MTYCQWNKEIAHKLIDNGSIVSQQLDGVKLSGIENYEFAQNINGVTSNNFSFQ